MAAFTTKQKQYIEKIIHGRQFIKIDKHFNNLDLNHFDMELSNDFERKFPGSRQFKKDSSSPTTVFKTTIDGKEYFVKVFHIKNQRKFNQEDPDNALLYEKEVYRYIRSKAVKNKDLKTHFIQMLLSAIDKRTRMGYIFTQDSGGVPLYLIASNRMALAEYFNDKQHNITAQFVANVFTQLLYVVYLLQSIHVVHNDLHFGNILLVKDNINTKQYEMFGQVFHVNNHPYTVKIYDFDMASIVEPTEWSNPFRAGVCEDYGRCADYLLTDLYVWLLHLTTSPETWMFVSNKEKLFYTKIIRLFKKNLQLKPKSFLQRLFRNNKTLQSQVVQMMERKSELHQRDMYPNPIFYASCDSYRTDFCRHPSTPMDPLKLAKAWKDALMSSSSV